MFQPRSDEPILAKRCRQRLGENIARAIGIYLQENMFTLQLLPKPRTAKKESLMEKQRRNILEDQRQQIEILYYQALEKRRLDDAQALKANLEEIERELSRL